MKHVKGVACMVQGILISLLHGRSPDGDGGGARGLRLLGDGPTRPQVAETLRERSREVSWRPQALAHFCNTCKIPVRTCLAACEAVTQPRWLGRGEKAGTE
eukprot:364531-Chlamydomonas_euryale.AAC.13